MKALREEVQQKSGRNKEPSVAIIDSRSIKSAGKGGRAANESRHNCRPIQPFCLFC
jgi:hypothetical protein